MKSVYQIIKTPLVTEKSASLQAKHNKYCFKVRVNSTKLEIKRAVEELFKVKVKKVATLRFQGKKRRYGRYEGYRPEWKKALVTLSQGQTIKEFPGA